MKLHHAERSAFGELGVDGGDGGVRHGCDEKADVRWCVSPVRQNVAEVKMRRNRLDPRRRDPPAVHFPEKSDRATRIEREAGEILIGDLDHLVPFIHEHIVTQRPDTREDALPVCQPLPGRRIPWDARQWSSERMPVQACWDCARKLTERLNVETRNAAIRALILWFPGQLIGWRQD